MYNVYASPTLYADTPPSAEAQRPLFTRCTDRVTVTINYNIDSIDDNQHL